MARGSRRNGSRPPTRILVPDRPRPVPLRPRALVLIEDRRTYHPLADARPVGVFSSRSQRRLVEREPIGNKYPPKYRDPFPSLRLGFAVPEKVVRCVRRKERREVMFAKKLRGAGSGARRRRRDEYSNVRC